MAYRSYIIFFSISIIAEIIIGVIIAEIIIGVPLLVFSCSSWMCPLYNKEYGHVISSTLVQTGCHKNYNCAHFDTNFSMGNDKYCFVNTNNHRYDINNTALIYVQKSNNNNCVVDLSNARQNMSPTGIMFLIFAATDVILLLLLVILYLKKCWEYRNYRNTALLHTQDYFQI